MRLYHFIIIELLITFINSICTELSPHSIKDCRGKLTDMEIKIGYNHCCLIEIGNLKYCLALTEEDYADYYRNKSFVKELMNQTFEIDNYNVECQLSFLKYEIINLIIFVLLL